jgi:hypothetical protein
VSTQSEKPTEIAAAEVDLLAPDDTTALRDPPPGSRTETQLRARVAELEAQLVDLSRCLADAENRAAELVAVRAELDTVQRNLAVIAASRSWRLTAPLRSGMRDVRRRLQG